MKKYKREYIPKKIREEIWVKYNHKCAYCGCDLEYKDMQLDHFIPYRKGKTNIELRENIQSINNYRASCRACNYYKRARGIESMRKDIEKIHIQLNKSFDYKLAKKYNLLEEKLHKIKFYFETLEEE